MPIRRSLVFTLALLVSIASAQIQLEQTFESATFPPVGWAAEYTGTLFWERANTGGYATSSHSAKFSFYDASGFEIQSLVTPQFSATGANDSLSFDHAYATYFDEVDSLIIDASTNGGTSYTRIVALEGGPTVGVGMVTALPTSGAFVPAASEWGTKRYALPTGTNKLRFTAKSAYGNNLYIDNIRVGQAYVNDVGVQEIVYPATFVNLPLARTPRAMLKNSGTAAQTVPFNITMRITGPGGFNYTSTKADTVSVNGVHEVAFDSTFFPAVAGSYSVVCFTDLAGEQFRANDTARATVAAANANFGSNGGIADLLYYFTNSLAGNGAPAQPEFGWKDTTGSIDLIVNGVAVAPITGDIDDGYFALGNVFPGRTFQLFGIAADTLIFVSTNGIVSFREGAFDYLPAAIPSGDAPNEAIYPLWADFDFSDPDVPLNRLSYKIDGDLLIVTYARAPRYNSQADSTDYVSFQLCMRFAASHNSNSFVQIQFDQSQTGSTFLDAYSRNAFAHLVGIENFDGTEATTYRFANGSTEIVHGPLFGSSLAVTLGPAYESHISVDLRSFLEGAYSIALHAMRTDLSLPFSQPYASLPWSFAGAENVSILPDSVVDWVLIELRDATGSTGRAARRAAFIKSLGAMSELDGTSSTAFQLMKPGDYYVVVHHRNHLSVMSATPLSLGTTSSSYDFTTAQSQAYGSLPMNQLESGVFGLVAGDANLSAVVTASDANEIFAVFNSPGYVFEDVNLSGIVTAADANVVFTNLNRSTEVPSAINSSPHRKTTSIKTKAASSVKSERKARVAKRSRHR
ncbi:MAG: choice-of-anchor J domain-containing protein [Ignavibacteriae bacterium]|nr:choice-of-anchor J domain-containing protein [Ignavibacteriota bacterium]